MYDEKVQKNKTRATNVNKALDLVQHGDIDAVLIQTVSMYYGNTATYFQVCKHDHVRLVIIGDGFELTGKAISAVVSKYNPDAGIYLDIGRAGDDIHGGFVIPNDATVSVVKTDGTEQELEEFLYEWDMREMEEDITNLEIVDSEDQ